VRGVRLRLVLPVALLLAVATPFLRTLPGGMVVPDPLLLLLLGVVPRRPTRLRGALVLVLVAGALRAAVSAVSPFAAWAGYGCGLLLRGWAQRLLSEERLAARFLLGFTAGGPLAFLDALASARIGVPLPWPSSLGRALLVGLLFALAGLRRPTPQQELASR